MTRRPLLLTALLLAATIAGCASDDPDAQDTADVPTTPVGQQLSEDVGVPVVAPTTTGDGALSAETPFLLTAATGPDSPLTAFEWRIPEGAILEYSPFEGSDFTVEEILFDVVPIFPDGNDTLEEFAILAVNFEDGEAYVSSSYVGVPSSGVMTGPLGTSDVSYDPELEPLRFRVYAGALEVGDRIGFVLMGKSAEPGSFGLLVSPLTSPPDDDEDPPETASELLRERTPVTLTPTGTGAGFQEAVYISLNINFLTAIYHIELRSGAVSVADSFPVRTPEPFLTVRDVTVSAEFPGRGHSEAFAYYFMFDILVPSCTSLVEYDFATDLHGTATQHRSIDVEVPAASLPTTIITGSPILFAVGEGDGAATTTLQADIKTACGLEMLLFDQLDLGATLADLTGTPSAVGAAAFRGLVGNIPPMLMDVDGDLVARDGHRIQTFPGLGWVAHPGEVPQPPA